MIISPYQEAAYRTSGDRHLACWGIISDVLTPCQHDTLRWAWNDPLPAHETLYHLSMTAKELSVPEMGQRETGIAEVNGAKLYYEVTGSGQPLVLLHAGIADRRMWDDQFDVFA